LALKTHRKGGVAKPPASLTDQGERSVGNPVTTAGFFVILGIALVAAWLAFLPSLSGPFIFDDFGLPFGKPNPGMQPASYWIGGVRPVLMASYWLNFLLWEQSPLPYHVVNLLLHALTAAFVYYCGLKLLKLAGVAESHQRTLAIFISGIFLLHPLQTESVDYIAGRSEVLTGAFYFAAFAIFLRRLGSEFGFGSVLAILALFGAATLSKEHAVTLPVLLVFTGIYWSESGKQHVRRSARLYLALAAVTAAGVVIALHTLAHAPSAGFGMTDPGWFQYFLTECRVVPIYLRLFFVPAGQSADWAFPFDRSPFDHGDVFYLVAISIAVALAIRYRRRAPLPCYGFLVFLLLLAPTSSVVPIKDALAERRMYLPIFGLAVAVAGVLASLSRNSERTGPLAARALKLTSRSLAVFVIAVLTVSAAISYRRSEVWTSETGLWRDVISKSPWNVRAYSALGTALVREHDCGAAIKAYQQSIILARGQSTDRPDQVSLAGAFICNHELPTARLILRGISSPETAKLHDELGVLSAKDGLGQQALSDFNDAIRIDPNFADAYAHRGLAESVGDTQAAKEDCRRALAMDPGNASGLECMRRLGIAP
jgi:hypothetical protein